MYYESFAVDFFSLNCDSFLHKKKNRILSK